MMPTRLSSEPSYGLALGTVVTKEPPGPAVMTTLHVVTPLILGQGAAFASPPASVAALRIALTTRRFPREMLLYVDHLVLYSTLITAMGPARNGSRQ
jgi:hypothetical protein